MLTIDCLGDFCPVPAMKLKEALGTDGVSEILLITDHSCVSSSVSEICRKRGLSLDVAEPVPGVWELRIKLTAISY